MELEKSTEISSCLEKAKTLLVKYGTSASEQSLKVQIEQFDTEDYVTFEVLKRVVEYLNEKDNKTLLHELVKSTKMKLNKPTKPSSKKDPEWLKLTASLRKQQADYEYSKLVSNVALRPKEEREAVHSFKGQLSVGLDLIVTMFTLFVLFYYASQYMFTGENKKQYQMLMGLTGLILGMLIDVTLVIVRSKKGEIIDKSQRVHKNLATNSYGVDTLPEDFKKRLRSKTYQPPSNSIENKKND